jgi:hypothetical protein
MWVFALFMRSTLTIEAKDDKGVIKIGRSCRQTIFIGFLSRQLARFSVPIAEVFLIAQSLLAKTLPSPYG